MNVSSSTGIGGPFAEPTPPIGPGTAPSAAPGVPRRVAPYGAWTSPITPELIVADTVSLDQPVIDGTDIYWIEGRPRAAGRCVLVRHRAGAKAGSGTDGSPGRNGKNADDSSAASAASAAGTVGTAGGAEPADIADPGIPCDLLPAPWNVRTRVHEYGGAAYLVRDGMVLFSHFADQRLYRFDSNGNNDAKGNDRSSGGKTAHSADAAPVALTAPSTRRFADGVIDVARRRLIAVCEEHVEGNREAVNSLVAIDLEDGHCHALTAGYNFYATPRISPDGKRLAWLAWNHPDMPWDGTILWVADINADGSLANLRQVAGSRTESVFQPAWSPDGRLYFVSDRSGWWNLYRTAVVNAGQPADGATRPAGSASQPTVEALLPMAAEFGRAQWNLGVATYGFETDGNLICSYVQNGSWQLARLDAASLRLTPFVLPFRTLSDVKVGAGFAVFIGGAPDTPNSIVRLDLASGEHCILRRAVGVTVDPGYLSTPRAIDFPTTGGEIAHAFHYAPHNRDFTAPPGSRPPLLVISHGGPTSTATTTLNLSIQFWTSRGFAVVDVNYGGSTGYGRAYRERLKGQWGVVDVDDAIAAARYLIANGQADADQVAIRGSSAGGYTTLAALTFHDFFRAGASYYGVSDLAALARDCHKFESRYLDSLIGPFPADEAFERSLYRSRSPIHFVDRLDVPLILFQGLEDKVVPPNQSQAMFDALAVKGLPVAYLTFEGEQHGFRRAENIRRALEAELYFYGRVFGFVDHDAPVAVEIHNLPLA